MWRLRLWTASRLTSARAPEFDVCTGAPIWTALQSEVPDTVPGSSQTEEDDPELLAVWLHCCAVVLSSNADDVSDGVVYVRAASLTPADIRETWRRFDIQYAYVEGEDDYHRTLLGLALTLFGYNRLTAA